MVSATTKARGRWNLPRNTRAGRPFRLTYQKLGAGLWLVVLLLVVGLWRQHQWLRTNPPAGPMAASPKLLRLQQQAVQQSPTTTKKKKVVYSKLRKDQAGWAIFDMLKAHAHAFFENKTYGGACGSSVHEDDVRRVLAAVGWDRILPLACPPPSESFLVRNSPYFQEKSGRRMGHPSWKNFIQNHTDFSYFDDRGDPGSSSSHYSIVVHVRRRDVTPCCYPEWYLPNSYFLSMIDSHLREYYEQQPPPEAGAGSPRPPEVLVFSQSSSHEAWDDFWHPSGAVALDGRPYRYYPTANLSVHLDGPIGEVWRAILAADVFVGSISEFSRIPALFTRARAQPDPRNITDPVLAEQTSGEQTRLLRGCSDRQLYSCNTKAWQRPSVASLLQNRTAVP